MKTSATSSQDKPSTEEIGKALHWLVNTATPLDRARVLRKHSDSVLTNTAIELLTSNIQRATEQGDAEAAAIFQHVQSLVEVARHEGLDAAIASLEREHLVSNLQPFIEAPSWADRKIMLEQNSELLLSESARKLLEELLEINVKFPEAIGQLQAASSFLTVARQNGTGAAIVWLQNQMLAQLAQRVDDGQQESAKALLKQLEAIIDPDDWLDINSHVIDFIAGRSQSANDYDWLFQLMREELQSAPTPTARASLAVKLGSSFLTSDNEDLIEESITWLKDALKIFEAGGMRPHGLYGTLGRAYMLRKSGDKTENLSKARQYLERELLNSDQTRDPDGWAVTQRLLGSAFMLLDLREAAIEHFAASLKESRDGVDERSAEAGLELARLRMKEQGPGRQAALEQAIKELEQAATKAPENSPLWARTQSVRANIYRERKSGEPTKNFEQGLYHTNQALRVFTHKLFPNEWAQMQHNLGTLYYTDVRGDRSDNIERAILSYNRALTVHTKEAYPQFYGLTCSALGLAMIERSAGMREQNLEDALQLLQEAEATLDPKESATWLAECWSGLGMIYSERMSGDERQNLRQAAKYMELARNAYHDLNNKEREHISFSNLGAIYMRLADFDPDAKLKAIQSAQKALEGADEQTDPYYWAMYNRNLGAAIFNQDNVTKENLNQALECLSNALKVYKPDTYLAEYRISQNYLGHVHFFNESWDLALQAYEAAIEAGQLSLASAYTEPGRRSLVRDTELAHVRSAYCLIQLGQFDKALVAVESGKTRLLREALSRSEVLPATVPEELVRRLRSGQEAVRALEGHMRQAVGRRALNVADIGQKLLQTRAELDDVAKQIRTYTPDFGEPIDNVSEILDLIPQHGALAAFVVTSHGSFAIVVEAGAKNVNANHIVPLPSLTSDTVNQMVNGWIGLIESATSLQTAQQFASWLATQRTSMNNLWKGLVAPIHAKLIELDINQGSTLLVLPQGGLWLIPFPAAARQVGARQRALADDYTIIHTPSVYVRKLCVERSEQRATVQPSLLAVEDPSEDLPFAAEEVSRIAQHFHNAVVLDGATATRRNVLGQSTAASYLHFACHGQHNWSDPMMSGLQLSGDDSLLLSGILADLVIDSNRLVILSACESGLADVSGAAEEFVGLPTGFLLAGATGVISSLWKVEDAATCLLMSRFYELHIESGHTPQNALTGAQEWFRNLTAQDLVNLGPAGQRLMELYPDEIINGSPTEKMCDYPFFWAGFIFVGA